MPTPRNSNFTVFNAVQGVGETETINSQSITGYLADTNGDLIWCSGLTVPTDGGTGYAKGCMFIDTNVATGTGGNYLNKGTNTSCQFTLVTQA